jgi:hypothetical protein
MARRNQAPKQRTKQAKASKKATPAKATAASKPASDDHVTLRHSANAVTISYSDPAQVLPHLLSLASSFAGQHFDSANFTADDDDVLGTVAARQIVSNCANSDCWNCALNDLKLDSNVFQSGVFDGVEAAGYLIQRTDIPATQSTELYTVVMAIQGAKKKV